MGDFLNARIYVCDDIADAQTALDEAGIEYDVDCGDRLMLNENDLDEACAVLDFAGIDAYIV